MAACVQHYSPPHQGPSNAFSLPASIKQHAPSPTHPTSAHTTPRASRILRPRPAKRYNHTVSTQASQHAPQSTRQNSISTASAAGGSGTRSSSWSAKDDETLIQSRAQGLNWNQIAPKHFPSKSPNACRKRHERLMERQNAEQWDGVKLEELAQAYMEVRREMWSLLASRVGEKWQLVELKCMEKGLRNLNQAFRSAQKKQVIDLHADSGIGISDIDEDDRSAPIDGPVKPTGFPSYHAYTQQQRVPSIQSILQHQPAMQAPYQTHHQYHPTLQSADADPHTSPRVIDRKSFPDHQSHPTQQQRVPSIQSISKHAPSYESVLHDVDMPTEPTTAGRTLDEQPNHGSRRPSPSCTLTRHVDSTSIINHASSTLDEQSGDESCTGTEVSTISGSDETYEHSFRSDSQISESNNALNSQKRLILHRLMTQFYEIFDASSFGYNSRGCSDSSSAQSVQTPAPTASANGRNKRKSNDRDDGQDNDDTGEGSGKRHKRNEDDSQCTTVEKRGFACPYFKHNPRKYHSSRSCSGPGGWDTIHRLKEHLYRRHTLQPQCARCCQTFESEAQLKEHSRSLDVCILREQEPLEGMDKSQVEKLKHRKKMFGVGSEEKWNIIYEILFPDTVPGTLPSPYYDDATKYTEPIEQSPTSGLAQYEAYMTRELPRKVRKELEIAIEKMIGPVEETLKNQLESLVRNCQERLSREFLRDRPSDDSLRQERQPGVERSTQETPLAGPSHVISDSRLVDYPVEAPHGTTLPQLTESFERHSWPSSVYGNMSFLNLADADVALPSDPSWAISNIDWLEYSSLPVPALGGKGKERAKSNGEIEEWDIVNDIS